MKMQLKNTDKYFQHIKSADEKLFKHFKGIIKIDNNLTRQLVSFQANKKRHSYRWYKYKEAFSASLVEYLLFQYNIPKGIIFDPFVGSQTALFSSSDVGYNTEGIELLPLGEQIIKICLRLFISI